MNKSYQNFKKRAGRVAVALTLAGATVVGGMAIGADAATYTNGYTNTSVKLKAGTSTSSSVLTTIKANQQVRVLGTSGNLLKVSYNGKTGYVAKTAIKNQYKITDCSYEVTTKKALTVRKGPGSAFVSAGRLAGDETVTVEGKTNNGWYLITYNGAKGYIPSGSNYVKYTINYTVTPCSYDVTTKLDLTVRQGAGQGYLSAGRLPEGTTVRVKGKTSNGWYLVDIDGVTRYIPSGSRYVYKVSENTAPIIAGDSIIYLDQTEINNFNTNMLGAAAYDNEDGKLTNISYSGDVNTSVAGTYNVTLSVTDKNGATTNKVVQVIVKDSSAPEISANAVYFALRGQKVDLSNLGITAYDKEDGDLTNDISFSPSTIVDGTNFYLNQSVEFDVSVKDKSGKVTTIKDIKLIFTDNKAPEVAFAKDSYGHDIRSITIYEGETLTRSSLISKLGVTGWDREDGKIEIKEGYVSLGNYEDKASSKPYRAYITAVDSQGKTSIKEEVWIYVKSVEKPFIKYINNKVNPVGDGYYSLKIPQYVDFDVTDLGAVATFKDPTTGKILPATLRYSNTTVGNDLHTTYRIVVTATYGNRVTTEYVDVVRTANAKPVIKTSNASEAHEWYYVGDTNTLTLTYGTTQDVIENKIIPKIVKVTDDKPGVKYTVSKVETQKIGPTVLTITATDNEGAKVEFSINVNVVDKIDQIIK